MGINWYAPRPKQSAEVKVTKSGIVFTETGMQKLLSIDPKFADTTHVRLGWDPDRRMVAVAPAPEGEKGHFKIGRRGRNQNARTVNAARFFEAFSLIPDENAPNDPHLTAEDGVALFRIHFAGSAPTSPRPRRRRTSKPSE